MSRLMTTLLAGVAALAAAGCVSDEGAAAPPAKAPEAKKEPAKPKIPANPWDGTGMTVWEDDKGGQWVFLDSDKAGVADFFSGKAPAKKETRPKLAPGGKDLHSNSAAALDAFALWKPGFAVRSQKEKDKTYVWIFKEGAKELAEFDKAGTLAKHTTKSIPGGPMVKGPDADTLDAYLAKKYPDKK